MRIRVGLERAGAILALALMLAGGAVAQDDGYRAPLKVDATTLAVKWLTGRFRMPVTCMKKDGSRLELEEAVVIRRAPQHGGPTTLQATFFGIDAPDLSHCFNFVLPRVPDRRGIIYLTFRSHERSDLGISEFRRRVRRGPLRYPISNGKLREREIGAEPREARVAKFDRRGIELVVGEIRAGSDADKLLAGYRQSEASQTRPLRRFEFEIQGPDDFSFRGYFVEDPEWRE